MHGLFRARTGLRRSTVASIGMAAALAGCSATADKVFDDYGNDGGAAPVSSSSSGGGGAGGAGGDDMGFGGQGGGGPVQGEVFAHSGDTLFKLDPVSKAVTVVGQFSGCPSAVLDIAIDEDGKMFGTTFGGLFRIDRTTARCSFITSGSYPNSLSFVPKGTLDPNVEALVGYDEATYMRIDPTTGMQTTIGSLGDGYVSSGDIVSVIGGGTYLTVQGEDCNDCIVQVNPVTGTLLRKIGPLGHSDVFGLAFWGGSAYGFSRSGKLFEINLTNARASVIPMPQAPSGLGFYGAGSTTAAPLTLPL